MFPTLKSIGVGSLWTGNIWGRRVDQWGEMGLSYNKRNNVSCWYLLLINDVASYVLLKKPLFNQFCSKHCDCRDTAMITITITTWFLLQLRPRPVAHYIVHLTCSVHNCVGKEKFLVFACVVLSSIVYVTDPLLMCFRCGVLAGAATETLSCHSCVSFLVRRGHICCRFDRAGMSTMYCGLSDKVNGKWFPIL